INPLVEKVGEVCFAGVPHNFLKIGGERVAVPELSIIVAYALPESAIAHFMPQHVKYPTSLLIRVDVQYQVEFTTGSVHNRRRIFLKILNDFVPISLFLLRQAV